ncbi:MAG: sigma-70 family RNA polymerase sigma factor [Acidobacteriota bacterium]
MLTEAETLTPPRAAAATSAPPMDEDAFARAVDRYKDRIVNYLTRLTGRRERAEDVAQEAFIRFYQNRHRYREEGTLQAYLFRIATNLVRSEERRKKRWRLLEPIFSRGGSSPDGVHCAENPHEQGPHGRAVASEEQRQVTAAIAQLDLHYRAPLVLREIEGLSYHEIADVLGLSEGTVKSRLHRAREQLKTLLEPYWKGAA